MAKPTLVYSSTRTNRKAIPREVLHIFITWHTNGAIRSSCHCGWAAETLTFDREVARAEYDVHASEAGS